MTPDQFPAAQRGCPTDEFLTAALTTGVTDTDAADLERHLERCDRCLEAAGLLLDRLQIADEIPAPLPDALRRRAANAAALPSPAVVPPPGLRPAAAPPRAAGSLATRWMAGLRRRGAALRHPPLMIPAALAAGAVLAVGMQSWLLPTTPRPLTRAVTISQHVRVTAVEAPVYRRPTGHAEVIATVTRGTLVDVTGSERDWLHVTLPDGTDGWLDQRALR